MSSRQTPLVAVIMGGPSSEREVSLSSGRACAAALQEAGYDTVEIDADETLGAQLTSLAPDVVFNALHGQFGEDGCVQGLLEWLRIPYTHSGVKASAVAIDKLLTKQLFEAAGLPVAQSVRISKADLAAGHPLPAPYVVKPYNEGSSVGIYFVHEGDGPLSLPDDMPDDVMAESYLPGRELTCSVLGERAMAVTEILTDGWYDYKAKYSAGGSRHVCPAELPAEVYAACQDYALRAHQTLGCRGLSRTDFRWDDSKGVDGIFLLETNTQPGMTATSLSPEQAQAEGMSFSALCAWLVEDASCGR